MPGVRKSRPNRQDYAVTPEVAAAVFGRDGERCVAPVVDPDCGPCTGLWSDEPLTTYTRQDLTLHHVQDGYGKTGRRAKSDPGHLVVVCWGHHTKVRRGRIWATSAASLSALREYLHHRAVHA